MKTKLNSPLWLFLLLLLIQSCFAGEWPEIDLLKIDPNTFKSKTATISKDPVYQTQKQYEGILLDQILEKLKDPGPYQEDDLLLVFTAQDGYKVTMSLSDARQKQGVIAYRDTAAKPQKKWQSFKFGKQTMTPAPFYLVWEGENIDKWRYPWPFQLVSITLQPASTYYSVAAPNHPNPEVQTGFHLFSTYCIRCHSINSVGGNVGPELNIPKNITEYFIAGELINFIRNAPAYRAGTKMPVFADIIDIDQTQSIIRYLEHKKLEKIDTQ